MKFQGLVFPLLAVWVRKVYRPTEASLTQTCVLQVWHVNLLPPLSSPSFLIGHCHFCPALPNHLGFLCTALHRWFLRFLSFFFRKFPLVSPQQTLKYPPCVTAMFCNLLASLYLLQYVMSFLFTRWLGTPSKFSLSKVGAVITCISLEPSRHLSLLHRSELNSCCVICGVHLCHPPSFFTVFIFSATGYQAQSTHP